ncbi:malate dehydrogenase [Cryobacterium sp. 1639]|uniref:malate dehydrogenase n=1 Tax=Cryobacterium inferilacus TaxID=2866629 RepID=UPI001C732872|nr:malate dehydrogenase [Cryobacterium sp. 1639]MBX0301655.1 malate dehydrogenase [Cryobacterium sp. 1639]
MQRQRVHVTVTGAGGNIGYALMFRIASGQLLGPDVPIALHLLEIPSGIQAAEGSAFELQDSAFPLLTDVTVTDDPVRAFDGVNVAILVGSRPRGPGQQRADLLDSNARIFGPQGAAINAGASDDVRVVVVGNPANTNALVAASHAPDVPTDRFTALTRLDHNRAVAQLAAHLSVPVTAVAGVAIWGNHSALQYPDVSHATVDGRPVRELVTDEWLVNEFIPRVANRGAEIIAVRGASSMGSAASATVDHVHDWVRGTGAHWTSAGVLSDGSYGVPAGLVSSYPVRSVDGSWVIEPGLSIDAFSRARIDASVAELAAERDAVEGLGLLGPRR